MSADMSLAGRLKRLVSHVPLWIPPRGMSWFVLTFFALMLLSVLLATEPWPWRSAIFPMVVAATGIVLAMIETAVAYVPVLQRRFAPRRVLDLGLVTDLSESEVKRRSTAALGWLIFLVAGIPVVGFHLIVPIFVVLYLRLLARASWMATASYGLITWVAIFVVFDRMMDVRWPTPLIGFW